MALLVQKYGGTSVADPDRMRNVAKHIAALRAQGTDVVAVVSAMGKATDNLVELARQVSSNPQGREMDMLLTTGELVPAHAPGHGAYACVSPRQAAAGTTRSAA